MGGYICNCTQGFNGKNCDQDINECETVPCQNGSTCLNTYGGYTCLCPPFFKGPFCNETDYCNQNVSKVFTVKLINQTILAQTTHQFEYNLTHCVQSIHNISELFSYVLHIAYIVFIHVRDT